MKSTPFVALGVAIIAMGAVTILTAGGPSGPSVPAVTAPGSTAPLTDGTGSVVPYDDRPLSDIAGEWVVLREVTSDTGLFGSDQFAELRQWDITCNDAACTDIDIATSVQGQSPDVAEPAAFDGEHLSLTSNTKYPCFVEADDAYSGPEAMTARETNELEVVVTDDDGRPTVMSGTYTYLDILDPTGEAAGCSPSVSGTEMDMIIVRAGQAVPAPLESVAGVVRGGANLTEVTGSGLSETGGGPSEIGRTEYPILPCADDTCEYMIRVAVGDEVVDISLIGDPEVGYTGSHVADTDCVDAETGDIIVVNGYATTTNVKIGAYEGADEPFMLMETLVESVPQGGGLDSDGCSPNTFTLVFGGRVVSDPMFYTPDGELAPS